MTKKIIASAGVILVLASTITAWSPDNDFVLSPGFVKREEVGHIHKQELRFNDSCNQQVYVSETENHIATVTKEFDESIIKVKVRVISNDSPLSLIKHDPVIIIKSVDGEYHICENDEDDEEEEIVFYTHQYTFKIPRDTYQVWIGSTIKYEESVKYVLEVEEHQI